MTDHRQRRRLFPLTAIVMISAFVFACGGGDDPADGSLVGSASAEPRPGAGQPSPDQPQSPNADLEDRNEAAPRRSAWELPEGLDSEQQDQAAAEQDAAIGGGQAGDEAGGEPAATRRTARRDSDGVKVFTNKDLSQYRPLIESFGLYDGPVDTGQSGDEATDEDDEDGDDAEENTGAKGKGGGDGMSGEERQAAIQETQKTLDDLYARKDYLQERIPSLQNPFLPRVQPSDEDRTAEMGMDNAQRLARVHEEISALEREIRAKRLELSNLESAGSAKGDQDGQ